MLKRLTLLSLALVASLTLAFGAPDGEIERRIAALDGVCETKPLPAGPFAGKYEVMLTQPLDWRHPDKGSFEQRVLVMHVGWDRPTVLITQGYDAGFALPERYRDELSELFDANIVFVEHRYFDRSTPEPLDWKYLTAENSACDLHRIKTLFETLYPGKWIASGISKGGTTTMLYAAYFPDDVDIYVPYVGPVCDSREDKRFGPYLAQVGTAGERAAVKAFQTEAFRRKAELLPGFEAFCKQKGYTFRIPVEEVFDYCVLEFGFSYWQWGQEVSVLPAADAPDEEVLQCLLANAGPDYFSEGSAQAPFFVQAARELGYYPYDAEPFRAYTSVDTEDYLRRIFLPEQLRGEKFSKRLYRKIVRYRKVSIGHAGRAKENQTAHFKRTRVAMLIWSFIIHSKITFHKRNHSVNCTPCSDLFYYTHFLSFLQAIRRIKSALPSISHCHLVVYRTEYADFIAAPQGRKQLCFVTVARNALDDRFGRQHLQLTDYDAHIVLKRHRRVCAAFV